MVASWLPRFASEAALYVWLDLTVQCFLINFELSVGGQDDADAATDGHPSSWRRS